MLRVDTGTSEEKELFNSIPVGPINEGNLDLQVIVEKVSRISIVGMDAANFGRREEDVFRLLFRIEGVDGGAIEEVEFCPATPDEVGVALGFQLPPDGASYHSAMAGDVNFGGFIHVEEWETGKQHPATGNRKMRWGMPRCRTRRSTRQMPGRGAIVEGARRGQLIRSYGDGFEMFTLTMLELVTGCDRLCM